MANRLARMYRREIADGRARITVVDQDDRHVYQPGLLLLPFGMYTKDEVSKPRRRQVARTVEYVQAAIDRVEPDADVVHLADGRTIPYDVLIVASGTRVAPEETEGMTGAGWREKVFDFYTVEGADALRQALAAFPGGTLAVNIVDMPIKCPVAPLEFAFLADWHLRERGLREKTELTYVTPLDGAFTKPVASERLGSMLAEKGIALETEFATGQVDGEAGRLVSYDEREVPFDLLVTIPLHAGAEFVGRSPGLGADLDFVPTDLRTLQSEAKPNVFALGDATSLPTSKAGSVTHFEGEVLTENVLRHLAGRELEGEYDGHANCFIETGFGKALLIDFNYETEPLPGRFPTAAGPLPLLKESRLNHLGKLMFEWVYWHVLLPGREIPGIPTTMSTAGKKQRVGGHA
jgi:sulfide:quinone oxidoreductase